MSLILPTHSPKLGRSQFVFDFNVVVQLAVLGIHGQQLTRTKRALFYNRGFVGRNHACFRTRDDKAVAGHDIAHRGAGRCGQDRHRPSDHRSWPRRRGPSHGSITELQ